MADQQPILECENLSISYFTRQGEIPAVVDFNLKVMPGEAVGVVGESGCGKSTVALAIMRYLGKNGRDRQRLVEVQGPRHDDDERGGAAAAARLRDRHGLPGTDGVLEPVAADRPAADGGPALP